MFSSVGLIVVSVLISIDRVEKMSVHAGFVWESWLESEMNG